MRALVRLLGDPQQAYPAVHITGTNGKGSTAAMATALLGAQGLTVGTYTSPNLSRVNERLSRNGEPIDDDALVEVLEALARLEPLMEDPPTRFELLTAAALAWFADEAVDVAVVEVGLGGRWDCTNVVDAEVAVLTNVSFDHTEVLGPTLEDIARDKSGIFKAGSRVVIGETDPTLVAQLRRAAEAAGAAEVWVRGNDFACTSNRLAVGGRLIDVRTPGAAYGELLVPLHGAHQGDNASTALAAVEAFFGSPLARGRWSRRRSPRCGCPVGSRWSAGTPWWWWTGPTTWPACWSWPDRSSRSSPSTARTRPWWACCPGRDPVAMLEALLTAGIRSVVACAPDSPRALPAEVVAEAASGLGMEVTVAATPGDAVQLALGRAGARRPGGGVRLPVRGGRGPSAAGPRHRLTGTRPAAVAGGSRGCRLACLGSWDEPLSSASPTPSNAAWWARSSAGSSARA